jgi:hypothetical protein
MWSAILTARIQDGLVRARALPAAGLLVTITIIFGGGFCLLASPTPASTAQLVDVVLPPYCKYNPPDVPCLPGSAKVLVYEGGAGEVNVVSLTGGSEEVRIGDRAAIIEPGPGCSRIDRQLGYAQQEPRGCLRWTARLLRWLGGRTCPGGGRPGGRAACDGETGGGPLAPSGSGGWSAPFWERRRSIRAAGSLGDSGHVIWTPFPAGLPARRSTAGPGPRRSRGSLGACTCRPSLT